MRKLTCTNRECKERVPFTPAQFGDRIACPACRQELLLPAPGPQEPTAAELGRPLGLPLAAAGTVVGIIVMSLALGGATMSGRVPTYADGKFVRTDPQKAKTDGKRDTGDAPGVVEPVPMPSGGRRLALLVGVRDYIAPIRSLRYTEADVVEFDRVLKQAGYETTLVTGKEATADNIRARFESVVGGCGPADLLVVAFAGHGIEKNGKFFYCPANARPDVPTSLVSINDVFDKLAACKAGSKFVFTDACRNDPNPDQRSGTLKVESLDDYKAVGGVELQVKPSGNVQAFYSCSPGEYSYEPEAYKHGVFFFYLIRAFQGEGDFDRDGKVTFPEVYQYVSKNVTSWGLNNRFSQRPNAKGDVNTLTPLAAWTTGSSVEFVGEAALRDDPATLLYENFRNVRANLPAGWSSPSFQVVTNEKSKRAALQTNKSVGFHSIRLPIRQARVTGDFSLKVDFELGYYGYDRPQVLELRLLGQQGTVIPVRVDGAGHISVAGTDPLTTERYRKQGANTLEVVRDGEVYVARLNGAKVTSTQPGYSGPIEEIWLGMHAGTHGQGPKAKAFQVSLHSLPSADGGAPSVDVPTTVVVNETFDLSARGSSLPQNWTGTDFQAATDDHNQRPCLQRNRPGLEFVTLPPVNLPGDFAVEVEYALSWLGVERPHVLHLRAEGDAGAANINLDTKGSRSVLGNTTPSGRPRLLEHAIHRVRVVRRAGVYQLFLDDSPKPVEQPNHANFAVKKIQIGLTGGLFREHPPARVYSVRVSALGPGGGAVPNWSRRDFIAAARGTAPANWGAPPGSLAVGGDDHNGWVELGAGVPGVNGLTDLQIPAGDFTLTALTHVRRGSDDAVVIGWAEGKKIMNFTLNGHGEYWTGLKRKDPPPLKVALSDDRQAEKIEVQKVRGTVVVRVDGRQVGGGPADVPAGRFLVSLTRGRATDPSPRIYSLELTVP